MAFPYTDLDVIIEAYLGADPTADPGTWPAPVDLSSRLLDQPITETRGRQPGQRTLSAGSCTFTLDNGDGALTPLLGSSPYYGDWDLGVPVKVSVDNVGASPPYPRFCGFVSDITVTIIPGVGGESLSVVKVTLGGKVRQMSQGSVAKSVMRRFIGARTPTAWWPLEDGSLGIGVAATPDTPPLFQTYAQTVGSDRWVSAEIVPWLLPGLSFDRGLYVIGGAIPGGPYTDIAVDIISRGLDVTDTVAGVTIATLAAGSSSQGWSLTGLWDGGGGAHKISITDTSSIVLDSEIGTANADALWDDHLHVWRLRVTESGSDVLVKGYLDGVEILSATKSSANLSSVHQLRFGANKVVTRVFAHAAVWTDGNIPDAADVYEAAAGYVGEQAHERIERNCDEEGIPYSSSATESRLVGPQPIADVLTVLRDAELVDHGMLIEAKDTWGFTYLAGSERYNRSAAMTIDLSTYRVSGGSPADVLRPVRNDQRIRNEWTISRPDGGQVTVADLAHQAKRGRYNDSAEVNVLDDDASVYEAAWRVWEGTFDGLRYAGLPIDLGANNGGDGSDDLLGAWLDMDLGDVIDRTDAPSQHPPDTVGVTLEGYTATIRRNAWAVAPVVEPFGTWDVRALADSAIDTDTDGWADWDSCTLAADVDEDDTSWSVACTSPATTTAAHYPHVVNVEGEHVTVTAVSGASSPQTWTVTRSTNGVSKSHDAGAVIESTELLIATL